MPVDEISLRPYQTECLDTIKRERQNGVHRQLVVLSTGAGKSIIGSRIPTWVGTRGKTLWGVHRRELIEQAADHLHRANPDARIGIEMASETAAPDCDIVVASFPTIGRANSKRIRKFDPAEFECVICDEAHHSDIDNETYVNALEYFGVGPHHPNPRKLFVGLTATPKRSSGKGLHDFFDKLVFQKHIRELISEEYLVPIRAFAIRSETDLDDVHTRYGDFVQRELADTVNDLARNELIVKSYLAKAPGRKALCFCASVEHAEAVAEKFGEYGLEARTVFGKTDLHERKETLRWFRETPGAILTNFAVLGEGADIPSCDCVICARPTKSSLVFTQMIGRGTRLSPETNKEDLIVLDVVDASSKAKVVTTATLFSLPDEMDCEGKDAMQVEEEFKSLQEEHPTLDLGDCLTMDEVRERLKHADLFEQADNEATEVSEYSWSRMQDQFMLHIPPPRNDDGVPSGRIAVERTLLGEWEASFFPKRNWRSYERQRQIPIATAPDLDQVIRMVDQYVNTHRPDAHMIMKKDAGWRRKPASEKQLRWMQKIAMRDDGMAAFLAKYDNPTRGQASAALSAYQARRGR